VSYVPFIAYRLAKIRKEREKDYKSTCFESTILFFATTPFLLVYLILVDIVFLVLSAIITPILLIISLVSCGKFDSKSVDVFIDSIF